MWDAISNLLDSMPPLQSEKNPALACVLGFLFGAVGLGIYFKSFVDFLMPLVLAIAVGMTLGDAGWFVGSIISGVYGYHRSLTSNIKLTSNSWVSAK